MKLKRWMTHFALASLVLTLGVAATGCASTVGEGPAMSDEPAAGTDAAAPADPTAGEAAMTVGTADNPIVMSFVPSGDTEQITAGADQIQALLQAETGLTIETNVATSYAAVIEAMGAGNAHVAWLPTLSYILAHEKYGVEPVLVVGRFGTTYGASQIIVKADSGITSLADLKGKSFCRPEVISTSGWIVPSVMMRAEGIDPDKDLGKMVEAGKHDAVVIAVYNGDCDAGGTFVDSRSQVEETYPDVMEKVVAIKTSDEIPNDNVSVVADLPADIVAKITDGLISIGKTPEGAEALKTVYGVETLEPADDTFYDAFRVTLGKAGVDVGSLLPQPK